MRPVPQPDAPRMPDRRAAGRALADALKQRELADPLVIALPRGGVPVADEIAGRLGAPLDVLVVRKVGAPGNPELAIGAVAEGGARVLRRRTIAACGAGLEEFERRARAEEDAVTRTAEQLRGDRPPLDPRGRDVVLVDDGMATGSTAEVAARVLRERGARRIVLAVPVASPDAVALLDPLVDDLVALRVPQDLFAVGAYFEDFSPVSTAEVARLLRAD